MPISKSKRTNSWSVQRFVDILTKAAGTQLGVSNLEEIVSIKVMNNTVVLEIQPRASRRGR
jgi:lipid-binding SYLF domain-containing protein